MISIKELISRIQFDQSLKKGDYEFFYEDRLSHKKIGFKFDDINEFGTFLLITKNSKDFELPMHRIKEVRKNNKLIWERKAKS